MRIADETRKLALVSHEHAKKQFRDACVEVGLTPNQRYEARAALHDYKAMIGEGKDEDMPFGELLAWMADWKNTCAS